MNFGRVDRVEDLTFNYVSIMEAILMDWKNEHSTFFETV